jgi:hyperosmotically inducible protein
MRKSFAVVLAGAALCAFSASGVYAQNPPKQSDTKVVVSDTSLTTAVKARLAKDKTAKTTDIDVKTDDGVVTITGAVPTTADKTRIGQLVKNTTGVKRVDNELKVGAATGTSGKSDETKIVIKDDAPKIKVKDTTPDVKVKVKDNTPDVKVKDTTPDVKIKDDGPTVKIKDDTTPAVKKGSKAVASGAKKAAGAVKDAAKKTADVTTDASVTTAVKTRLLKDEVATSTDIDVSTDDGVVTIKGTVPTNADKLRIGKLVGDTAGVKRVVNELKIAS